jgi:hypothetical protein
VVVDKGKRTDAPDALLVEHPTWEEWYQAIEQFQAALAIRPDHPAVHYNLARSLLVLDRLEEAETHCRAALAHAPPDVPPARLSDMTARLCEVLVAMGRPRAALAACQAALARHPDLVDIEWNESLALLMLGDYAAGWRKYETRWRVHGHDPLPERATVIDPARVAGKRVLVLAEQGRGDVWQFARYVPLLARRGARISMQAHGDMQAVLRLLPEVEQVVDPDSDWPEADLVTPLLSLPLAFGTEVASIPAEMPYLQVPEGRAAAWRARLGPRSRPRIGLAWRGSQHIPQRSMPLATLAPLLDRGDVEFHALQKDITPTDRAWLARHGGLTDHSESLTDFADTAALIGLMDLVVTIDTSVAHLAGALAAPVWIMLPFSADRRWLLDREDSPWYPTARLFRQSRRGDWDGVVDRVAAALACGVGSPVRDGRT